MSHRWQRFVFIATPTVIILLNVQHYHQRRNTIISSIAEYQIPLEHPAYFLWPDELIELETTVASYKQNFEEKKDLFFEAQQLGIDYSQNMPREELESIIEVHKLASLIASVQNKQQKMKFRGTYAPTSVADNADIWNLGLIGLSTVKIDSLEVMQYELTNASAWLLGLDREWDHKCWFCATQISFSEAKDLADHLSLSIGKTPCYQQEKLVRPCDGWRLPTIQEWEIARGSIDQKWEYLVSKNIDKKFKSGTVSPNMYNVFDIAGNREEWLEEQMAIGKTERGDEQKSSAAGLRLYRNE